MCFQLATLDMAVERSIMLELCRFKCPVVLRPSYQLPTLPTLPYLARVLKLPVIAFTFSRYTRPTSFRPLNTMVEENRGGMGCMPWPSRCVEKPLKGCFNGYSRRKSPLPRQHVINTSWSHWPTRRPIRFRAPNIMSRQSARLPSVAYFRIPYTDNRPLST